MDILLQKFFDFVLDILFPIKCISCKKENFWICEECLSKIVVLTEHVCPICEKVFTPNGKTCINCKRKSYLDGLLPAASYKDFIISTAIHHFKYRFIKDLNKDLGKIITKALLKTELTVPDLIIPVPLHPRRLRWRGFNQSFLLAQQVSKNLLDFTEIQILENILIRKKYTHPQMGIKEFALRQKNISNSFEVNDPRAINGKTILLIDDVATTGSTIFECAKVLKKAGALEVYAAVIARQEIR